MGLDCTNPWAGVRPGVPPGAEVEKIVDVYDFADGRLAYSYPVRNAQMEVALAPPERDGTRPLCVHWCVPR